MQIAAIDPLNFSVLKVESLFDDEHLAWATGFFYSGLLDNKPCQWLVTNWHVLSGRNASKPENVLHKMAAIPNRIRIQLPSRIDSDCKEQTGKLFFHEKFISLYDSDGLAMWYQHPTKSAVDIAVINVGSQLMGHLATGVNELCTECDMAIEIGNQVFVLGYPLGLSHFANTPIWKRGAIASEPHYETPSSRNKIVIDATTRKGMSGAPVIMREKTHYLAESGVVKQKANASRFVGVYASRPALVSNSAIEEVEASLASHEVGYVFKSGCVHEVIVAGLRARRYGELP